MNKIIAILGLLIVSMSGFGQSLGLDTLNYGSYPNDKSADKFYYHSRDADNNFRLIDTFAVSRDELADTAAVLRSEISTGGISWTAIKDTAANVVGDSLVNYTKYQEFTDSVAALRGDIGSGGSGEIAWSDTTATIATKYDLDTLSTSVHDSINSLRSDIGSSGSSGLTEGEVASLVGDTMVNYTKTVDLNYFTNSDETDQVWVSDSADYLSKSSYTDSISNLTITESQITDLTHFTNSDETDQVFVASQAFNIDAGDITNLGNLSGTNTGDQDLSSYATKTQAQDSADVAVSEHAALTTTHGVSGDIVGTTDSQVLTTKTIDSDNNNISNIVNADIKAAAGIVESKLTLDYPTSDLLDSIQAIQNDTLMYKEFYTGELTAGVTKQVEHGLSISEYFLNVRDTSGNNNALVALLRPSAVLDSTNYIDIQTSVSLPAPGLKVQLIGAAVNLTVFTNADETDQVYTASQAANIDAGDITNLGNLSGINTGDQDLSSYATKTQAADSADAAIADYVATDTLVVGVALSDETTDLTTGTNKIKIPFAFAATVLDVRAFVSTAPTGSAVVVDINENGTSVLSTKLTIDVNDTISTNSSVPVVISDNSFGSFSIISFDIDQTGSGIAGKGLKVYIYYIKQ